MKKSILALALVAIASMTASAASVNWETTTLYFEGTKLARETNVAAYFIYLPSGDFASSYTIDATFKPSDIGAVEAENTEGTGKPALLSGALKFDVGAGELVHDNGDSFGLLLKYTVADGTYYNLSSDIRSLAGIADDRFSGTFEPYTFNSNLGTNPTLTAGGGWVKAVPEPATGALALAGLALLFRRRRA